MLFDLRARGRRTTVKVVYLFLAVIMAVGLIGFGIGGATNGGWIDSLFGGGSSSSNNDVFEKRVDEAKTKLAANPKDQAALAALVTARYQVAQLQTTEADAKAQLQLAVRAWDRYMALDPKTIDDRAARAAVNIFVTQEINDPAKAAAAQSAVIDNAGADATAAQYAQLFTYAYAGNQTRIADLAYDKALELSPSKESRAQIKAQMDQVKSAATSSTSSGTTTTAPGTPTTSSTTGE
jgi:hypothetical protein